MEHHIETTEERMDLTRDWSDIDSDEQEYLDYLQTFGDGFFDREFHPQFSSEIQ